MLRVNGDPSSLALKVRQYRHEQLGKGITGSIVLWVVPSDMGLMAGFGCDPVIGSAIGHSNLYQDHCFSSAG